MIKNFDEVKRQLSELASVINSFKSESVQLRIIELVLKAGGQVGDDITDSEAASDPGTQALSRKGPRRRVRKAKAEAGDGKGKKRSSSGPAAILEVLISEGFFKKRQTIGQIVEHCNSSKARSVKPNEISGPLGRFVRNTKLKRQRNADGQYEYFT